MAIEGVNQQTIESLMTLMAGGTLASLMIAFGVIVLAFGAIIYIYHAICWSKIAQKKGFKNHWLSWIPFASIAMRLQLGGFSWALIFLLLIPVVGWLAVLILLSIAQWKIFESITNEGWISLSFPLIFLPYVGSVSLILYLISVGLVAFTKDKKVTKKRK